MAYNLKEVIADKPSRFTSGHRMCAGCGAPPVARHIMRALKPEDHEELQQLLDVWEFYIYLSIYIMDRFFYPYSI